MIRVYAPRIALLTLLSAHVPALPDDVSRNAGVCAAVMSLLRDDLGAKRAIATAPNRVLAQNLAFDYVQRFYASHANPDDISTEGMNACAAIGLRPVSARQPNK